MSNRQDLVEAQTFLVRSMTGALSGLDANQRDRERPRLGRGLLGGALIAILGAGAAALTGVITGDPATPVPAEGAVQVMDTGEYYVSFDGVLHPALNLASARLAGGSVTRVHSSALRGIPRGLPVGIPGAPTSLPPQVALAADGWTMCADDAGIAVLIGFPTPDAITEGSGIAAADAEGTTWLITGGKRYAVSAELLDVVGISTSRVIDVPTAVIALLPAAEPIQPMPVPGAGAAPATDLGFPARVGDVAVAEAPGGSRRYYLVQPDGLAQLSEIQYAVLSQSAPASHQIDLAQAGAAPSQLRAPDRVSWPRELPIVQSSPVQLCVSSSDPPLVSTASPGPAGHPVTTVRPPGPSGLRVSVAGRAALVTRGEGFTYVDQSGLAYPVPDAAALQRLGYDPATGDGVTAPFVALLPAGPTLDPAQAAAEVQPGAGAGP